MKSGDPFDCIRIHLEFNIFNKFNELHKTAF